MWTQQQRDQRSLDRHRVIAERIRADPIVVVEAVKVIFRWQEIASKASHWYLYEWLKVLAMDLEDCVAAMVAPTEAGNALRQCSPFVRVFSPEERWAFIATWQPHDEMTPYRFPTQDEIAKLVPPIF